MILGGDEISRTQNGNNNAYCQDNETTWMDWRLDGCKISLLEFTQKLIQIRRDHPSLHRRKFYQGRAIRGTEEKDIVWLRPDGQEMSDEEWGLGWVRCLGMMLNGETIGEVDRCRRDRSRTIRSSSCSTAITSRYNSSSRTPPGSEKWEIVIDTNDPSAGWQILALPNPARRLSWCRSRWWSAANPQRPAFPVC